MTNWKIGDDVWCLRNDGDATAHPSGPHQIQFVAKAGGLVHLQGHIAGIQPDRIFATEEQAWTAVLLILGRIAQRNRRAADICDRRADVIRGALLRKQIKFL